ncbi:hypothetical protein [Gynuella sp.]|uniref:hypothetical protein n=1 Tax=Gynuella sp. TaxID=2969146 RepID=UPI003D0F6F76
MIRNIFKKEKARVYLDKLMVIPKQDYMKSDEWGFIGKEDLEGGIREKLTELFSLPHISSRTDAKKTDLGLEVAVVNFQGGEFDGISLGSLGAVPIFWRPKVSVVSRLFNIESGKTIKTAKYCAKMPWNQYLRGVFSLRGFIRYKPIFGIEDIEQLLYFACHQVLSKLIRAT